MTLPKILVPLAVAALAVPAAAGAADHTLGGAPTLHSIDAHHATLEFAASRAPDKIVLTNGRTLSALKTDGYHGYDHRYVATLTSKTALKLGTKYTMRFEWSGESPKKLLVKLQK
jgi:hypothetical protein